ncbi:dihydroxyacetone kinase, partial [Pseudomonas syringae]
MKELINDPNSVVEDMLEGAGLANQNLMLLEGENIVVRRDYQALAAATKVSIVSGGGAGHSPAHACYVGHGMLTAAVAGPVLSSPIFAAVPSATIAVAGAAGAVLDLERPDP